MVTLLFIKPHRNSEPFLSKPISNVDCPKISWEANNRASYLSMNTSHVAHIYMLASSPTHLTCMLPAILPRNNMLFLQFFPCNPSLILLLPPAIFYFLHVYDLPPNKIHNSGLTAVHLTVCTFTSPTSHVISL